jgi:uncharacterized protein YndB with AHSA1/START domain
MSKRFAVTRTISAKPDRIWALLTDGPGYPQWNPAVLSIDGTIEAGKSIRLVSVVNPRRAFTLQVREAEPSRRMVWADGMPLGLFSGVRTFTLRPQGDGRTEFSMVEEYRGPLAPMITRAIPDMSESFTLIADGLKQAAESAR